MRAFPSAIWSRAWAMSPRVTAQLYSAPYHIGKSVRDDIEEYRRRSPVNHVEDLETPLAHPRQHQRRRRELPRSRTSHSGAKSRRQEIRVQGLSECARRALLQSHRYELARESRRGSVPLPRRLSAPRQPAEIAHAQSPSARNQIDTETAIVLDLSVFVTICK